MWKIWWAHYNASKWQMEFNSAFKGINRTICCVLLMLIFILVLSSCMFSFFQFTFPQMFFYHCFQWCIVVHLPAFLFNFIRTSSAISSYSGHISIQPPLIYAVSLIFFTASFYFPGITFFHFSPSLAFSSQFSYMRFVFYITSCTTSSATTVQNIDPPSPHMNLW
jgi:hypothetical protein